MADSLGLGIHGITALRHNAENKIKRTLVCAIKTGTSIDVITECGSPVLIAIFSAFFFYDYTKHYTHTHIPFCHLSMQYFLK